MLCAPEFACDGELRLPSFPSDADLPDAPLHRNRKLANWNTHTKSGSAPGFLLRKPYLRTEVSLWIHSRGTGPDNSSIISPPVSALTVIVLKIYKSLLQHYCEPVMDSLVRMINATAGKVHSCSQPPAGKDVHSTRQDQ